MPCIKNSRQLYYGLRCHRALSFRSIMWLSFRSTKNIQSEQNVKRSVSNCFIYIIPLLPSYKYDDIIVVSCCEKQNFSALICSLVAHWVAAPPPFAPPLNTRRRPLTPCREKSSWWSPTSWWSAWRACARCGRASRRSACRPPACGSCRGTCTCWWARISSVLRDSRPSWRGPLKKWKQRQNAHNNGPWDL